MTEPTDADIETLLRAAPELAWVELGAALDELEAEDVHGVWKGGQIIDSMIDEDGTERPVRQMPYVEVGDRLIRVLGAVGGVGAVVPFDWPAWKAEFARYADVGQLASASVADAVRVVTTVIRGDRFVEGMLLGSAEDGQLAAALRRMLRWHEEEDAG